MAANKTFVVVPNWNGVDSIAAALDSLQAQTYKTIIVVVDNGSEDGSIELIKKKYPDVILLEQSKNLGFAGGVNVGIKHAIEHDAEYVALFNNDATADKNWLSNLIDRLENEPKAGIATGKLMRSDKEHIDSTGEFYTIWGMPFPRGRNELDQAQFDKAELVFAASGGASLYRVEMLKQIGLFDEDFFAYFEDVDISFRAQLSGWKVWYEPAAVAYHAVGATSSKLPGFTTYNTAKNFMMLYAKNMPGKLYFKYFIPFFIYLCRWFVTSLLRGRIRPFIKGVMSAFALFLETAKRRRQIQKSRQVSVKYIDEMLVRHMPPKPPKMETQTK